MASGPVNPRDRKAAVRKAADEPESQVSTARARPAKENPFEQMRGMTRELGSSIEIMRKLLGKDWAGGKPLTPMRLDKKADPVVVTRPDRKTLPAAVDVTRPDRKTLPAAVEPKRVESSYAGLAKASQARQGARIVDRPTKEAMATLLAPEARESRQDVSRLVTARSGTPSVSLRKEPTSAQRAELPTAARVQQVMNANQITGGASPTVARLAEQVKANRESVASIPPAQLVAKIKAELGTEAHKALEAPNVRRLTAARDSQGATIRGILASVGKNDRTKLTEAVAARRGGATATPSGPMPASNAQLAPPTSGRSTASLAHGPMRRGGPELAAALEQPGAEATAALRGNDEPHMQQVQADLMANKAAPGKAALREDPVSISRAKATPSALESPMAELAPGRVSASTAALSKGEPSRQESKPTKMTITIRDKSGHSLLTGDAEMS